MLQFALGVNHQFTFKGILMIDDVIKHFGGTRAFMRLMGVSRMAISKWRKEGCLPPARALQVEHLSGGKFKASRLVSVVVVHGGEK